MTNIKVDMELLKQLRATTGVGLSDCREALVESKNDLNKALEILKIKGLSKAMEKVNNAAVEGITKVLIDQNRAVIVELNCQTDFVANNLEFNNLLNQVLVTIIKAKPITTVAQALALPVSKTETLNDAITKAITKLGENIVLRRFKVVEKHNNEIFGSYVHTGGVRAGLVVLDGTKDSELAKNIAMQVVAMNPKFIDVSEIDPKYREKELAIAKEQVKDINKPKEIIDRMIEGKVNKALAELTINNQSYIKEPGITIKQYLNKNSATIKKIIRYEVGELI
ncbi:MAG: translation elongation factor Ts [Spiroplasma sp.]|nr:translation elongation factor Ts [Spiroplasma sp.]